MMELPGGPRASGLVGRQAELSALGEVLERVGQAASGAWAQVVGEPGIGKSRLLAEFARQAEERGALVLAGRGTELERDVPYAVLIDALDAYLGAIDHAQIRTWNVEGLGWLGEVFPSLGWVPDRAHVENAGERYRLHRAVREILERLAADRTLVLILDDVHWADAASSELIGSLVRRAPRGVLVVLAWRPGQAGDLWLSLNDAARDHPGVDVTLGGLDDDDLLRLIGPELEAATADAVVTASAGNPFYALALERHARSGAVQGAQPAAGAAQVGMPDAVLVAVRAEIDSLSPRARQMAHGAAVAGDPFEVELAAACAELESAEALAGVDELVDRQIIRVGESPREFSFRHPMVRRAMYDSAGAGWRLGAHARAAATLERWGALIPMRAHHVALSARPGDLGAVDLLVGAAAEVRGFAPASAAAWLAMALQVLPDTAAHCLRRVALLRSYADVQALLGELQAAHEALQRALALAAGGEDQEVAMELTVRCVEVEHVLGRWEQGRVRLRAMLATMGEPPAPLRAELELALALSHLFWMDFSAAAQWAERAAGRADGALQAAATALLGFVCACTDNIPDARARCAQAADELDRTADIELAGRLDALYYLGRAEYLLEDFAAAARHFERGISIAIVQGGSRHLLLIKVEQARTLAVRGDLGRARRLVEEVVEAAQLAGQEWSLGLGLAALAPILRTIGELDAARLAGEQAADITEAAGAGELARGIRRELALTWLEAGDPDRCAEALTAAGTPGEAHVEPGSRCLLAEALTHAELARGERRAARGWAESAERWSAPLDLPLSRAYARRAMARVLLADGDAEGAVGAAREAVALAKAAHAAVERARGLPVLARALLEAGERDQAVATLREAERALGRCGASRQRDAAARELRRLGVRAPARRASQASGTVASLSRRELEVAGLVAAGHSNRQVAAELYLSENTIETHLRRIYAKLEINSRAALASAIGRHQAADAAG
jgi:DNA-binding NarL/FixJ family response regulator